MFFANCFALCFHDKCKSCLTKTRQFAGCSKPPQTGGTRPPQQKLAALTTQTSQGPFNINTSMGYRSWANGQPSQKPTLATWFAYPLRGQFGPNEAAKIRQTCQHNKNILGGGVEVSLVQAIIFD
jgi:hypothetical protein